MSTTNRNHKPTITEQRIKSSKGLQMLCAIVALLSDIAVLAVLLTNATEFKFWIFPLLIAVLDAAFIFKVIFSNYRFSYALGGVILHIVMILAASAFAWLITGYMEERIVYEMIALYAMPALHLVQSFALLFTALHACKRGKLFRRVLTVALTVLFVASVALYGNFLFTNGFFGQGFVPENRTVVYSLDETRNCYVVEGVLKGRGDTVVIPETFNGLPVGGVDCSLFANDEITTVQLDCAATVTFENVESILTAREDLQILVGKADLDTFRSVFYALVEDNAEALYLGNSVCPDDLDEDEIYVTFRYSLESLRTVGSEILPTWFATEGTVFSLSEHAGKVPYVVHSNAANERDLYYCYTQQHGLIFREAIDETNADIDEKLLDKSINATMVFDKIYRLSIAEDNDEKYTIAEEFRFAQTASSGAFPYKLATAETAQNVLNALPMRNGFDFAWKVGADQHNLKNIRTELLLLDGQGKDCLELYPTWALKNPTIVSLTADGMAQGHSALYGNDVMLVSTATAPASDISIRYEWKRNTVLSTADSHKIVNLHPADAGEYTLTVTAYSDTVTSLTSTTTRKITVGFEKRELNFSWQLPPDTVYSAYDKPISATHDATDVINDDEISFTLSRNSVRDAGDYQISIALLGDTNEKYKIVTADKQRLVTVTPYRLNVDWGTRVSFEYCGIPVAPTASAMGLGEDGAIDIEVKGEQQNVGSYTASAHTTNKNYVLAGDTLTYSITHRPITITAWNKDTLVYNGGEQSVAVSAVSNAVAGEELKVIAEMIYLGKGVNVGGYLTAASLPQNSNYIIVGESSKSFTITPKPITVTILNQAMEYCGAPFQNFKFSVSGLEGKDRVEEVLSLNYKGAAVTAINASDIPYVIDADQIGGVKYGNYTVDLKTGILKIEKKALDIHLTSVEKIYDGRIYPYEDFAFTHTGLVSSDALEQVCTLNFKGTALNAITVSTNPYTLEAQTVAQEKYGNYKITVHPATLTIKKAPLSVTAIGGSKIYDGTVGSGFTVSVSGLVGGETVGQLGTPIFEGAAKTNANVGKHVLRVHFEENAITRNYNITPENGTFEILPKDLTVTAIGGTKVYNGLMGGNFDFTVSGLVAGETKSQLGEPKYGGSARTAKDVNRYVLTVSFDPNTVTSNYNIHYVNAEFVITPKPVTVSVVSASKVYDGLATGDSFFNFNIVGLVGGDTKASFGTPIFKGTARGAINAGRYTLSVELPGNPNYQIDSYESGSFEILKKTLIVSPVAESRVYDGTVGGNFDVTLTGLVGSDTRALFGTPEFEGDALTAKNAGYYTLLVKELPFNSTVENYELIYTSGSFEIKKRALTITVVAFDRDYDGTLGCEFDCEVEGLAQGDPRESIEKFLKFDGSAILATDPGVYTLTVSVEPLNPEDPELRILDNYDITCVPDTEFEIFSTGTTETDQ